MEGINEVNALAPEKNPYRSANTVTAATDFTPNIEKSKIVDTNAIGQMTLKRPKISANAFGMSRPAIEPVLRMATCICMSTSAVLMYSLHTL